jgi:type IV secretory pathway VirB6-like protein
MGHSLFIAFATILIAWQGIRMMLTRDALGDDMFQFAKLLLFISFGYALIAFYESPIPGIGVSFSNLITDQAHLLANILDARSLELVFEHLDTLWGQFVQPDAWSILANLLYWLLLIVVTVAKVIALAVVAFGLIASAVCALVGPIFVPFFIVPKLDWLFWSWFKAFIQYSFVPVVAFAFLMIFERFIFQYLTTLPPGITEDYYLVYGLQALVIIGVFALGILLVPSLTNAIFSGRGGESIFPDRVVRF